VFASLAVANAVPDGQQFLNQLRPSLTPKQVQDGQKLLQMELAARNQDLMSVPGDGRLSKLENAP
jgi:hypothetical protein